MGTNKLFQVHSTPYHWCYSLGGVICLLLAAVLAPLWSGTGVFWRDFGNTAVDILLALTILVYISTHLVREASREGVTSVRVLLIVEIAVLLLIAVGCVLKQLSIIKVGSAAEVLGVAVWLRGTVTVLRAYLYRSRTVLHLALGIAMVTVGTVLVVRPLFSDTTLRWMLAALVLVLGITLLVLGALCRPKAKKAKRK